MNTKLLKQKILDLAIRGKLVPQDPNDEPASELLKRIRAEKEKLIAEGKIKRSKKTGDKPHYENVNAPFEIPASWEWVTLPDLCSIPITDGTHQTPTYAERQNGIPFLSSKDVTTGKINWSDIKYITKELHQELYKRVAPFRNEILLAKNGTTGIAALVDTDIVFDIYVTLALIRPVKYISPRYLLYVINSRFCKEQFNDHLTGIGLPNLHLRDINKTFIPLPPIEEQQRIVAKLDNWFEQIENLDSNREDLQRFIQQTKSMVLSLAIHGKLVPQDPNDEPAVELLKRINPNAPICDTSHYENLPKGWCVLTVGQVADYINGRAFKPNEWEKEGLPIIRIQNLNDENAVYNYSTAKYEDRFLVHKGDLLFAWAASLGTYIWQKDDAWLNQHIFKVIPKPFIDKVFLYFSFINMIDDFYSESHGSGMVHITKGKFEEKPIFIPPLMEQKRIVLQLKSIYNIIDSICSEL